MRNNWSKAAMVTMCCLVMCLFAQNPLHAANDRGRDFWVTFPQNYEDANYTVTPVLQFTAEENAQVLVENPYTGYSNLINVSPEGVTQINLELNDCYLHDSVSEIVSNHALHITATAPITVVAGNCRNKNSDATALIPTPYLGSEYMVQCYSPSSHDARPHGSHFAIVATEDNTIVDYIPTAATPHIRSAKSMYDYMGGDFMSPEELALANWQMGDTFTTPVLQKGQVFYVYTGNGGGDDYDLSGTRIKARDNKQIVVFEGNPMTNIPYQVRDRDHLYSQAIPTTYWGTKYALVSSLTKIDGKNGTWERLDKVRVMASEDGTVVKVNGEIVHIFDFINGDEDDKKHFFEFEFGVLDSMSNWTQDPSRPNILRIQSSTCYLETTTPCAVHQFTVSNRYDHDKSTKNGNYCNGDPSMMSLLPLEYMPKTIQFAPFSQTSITDFFLNIVAPTNRINSVQLDNVSISNQFAPLQGNSSLMYARIPINNSLHVLSSASGVSASLYGIGNREEYAYALGFSDIHMPQIEINDMRFELPYEWSVDFCAQDGLTLNCHTDFQFQSMKVVYGDGTESVAQNDTIASFEHTYSEAGIYQAKLIIEQPATAFASHKIDTIHMEVTVGPFVVTYEPIGDIFMEEVNSFKIIYQSPIPLRDNAHIHFDNVASEDGFRDYDIMIKPDYLEIQIPQTAQANTLYQLVIEVYHSYCDSWPTIIPFELKLLPRDTITYVCNEEQGYILGETIVIRGDTAHFRAYPNYGYHFTQWSDGVKDNPRSCVVTQDTTFTAEFAVDRSGTCGDDNALTWTYDTITKTLSISGSGQLTYNYSYGIEAPKQMQNLIIGNEVTAIGNSAFYGMRTINHLTIGSNVASIGDYAFSECRGFDDITCYATTVPAITAYTFANIGNKQYIYLYVPEDRKRAYLRDEFWSEFDIQIKGAEETTTDGSVAVIPSDNTVEITWPWVSGAQTYEIVITKDGEVVCTLIFNANGQLAGIAFAPGRNGTNHTQQAQTTGFKFTVTGLNSGTLYGYAIDSKNEGGWTIDHKSGSFTTTVEGETVSPTEGIDAISTGGKPDKILHNGQILILRGDHTYTLQGQEVK